MPWNVQGIRSSLFQELLDIVEAPGLAFKMFGGGGNLL
jgi:hypothetical protein